MGAWKLLISAYNCLMQSDPEPESGPGQELEALVTLVEDYESKRFKLSLAGVIDTVLFRMKEAGLRQKNSEPFSLKKRRNCESA